jgi:hypothetical protein
MGQAPVLPPPDSFLAACEAVAVTDLSWTTYLKLVSGSGPPNPSGSGTRPWAERPGPQREGLPPEAGPNPSGSGRGTNHPTADPQPQVPPPKVPPVVAKARPSGANRHRPRPKRKQPPTAGWNPMTGVCDYRPVGAAAGHASSVVSTEDAPLLTDLRTLIETFAKFLPLPPDTDP